LDIVIVDDVAVLDDGLPDVLFVGGVSVVDEVVLLDYLA
jgi:hypothetical protein